MIDWFKSFSKNDFISFKSFFELIFATLLYRYMQCSNLIILLFSSSLLMLILLVHVKYFPHNFYVWVVIENLSVLVFACVASSSPIFFCLFIFSAIIDSSMLVAFLFLNNNFWLISPVPYGLPTGYCPA
jgi:hypothetical protein